MSETANTAPVVASTSPDLVSQIEAKFTPEVKAPEAQVDEMKPVEVKAPEAPKSSKKKYKIKVDKHEEELEFDPSNEEDVVKHLQKSRASDKRFQEASEVRKAAMEFIEQLKTNPRKVLSDPNIGIDIKKFAEEIINEQIAEMEKTPEQREKEELQRQVKEYQEKSKKAEEESKRKDFERMQIEQEKELETGISAALDVGGVPKTPRTVARMAEMLMIALHNNVDLSPKDLVPILKENTMSEFKEVMSGLADDQLEDYLGKELISRLRKNNVAKSKAPATASQVKSAGTDPKTKKEPEPAKKMSIREFLKV